MLSVLSFESIYIGSEGSSRLTRRSSRAYSQIIPETSVDGGEIQSPRGLLGKRKSNEQIEGDRSGNNTDALWLYVTSLSYRRQDKKKGKSFHGFFRIKAGITKS